MENRKKSFLENFGKCIYHSRNKVTLLFGIVIIISIVFGANVISKLNQGATGNTFEAPGSKVELAHQVIVNTRGFSAQPSVLVLVNLHNLSIVKEKNIINNVIKVLHNEPSIKKVINPLFIDRKKFTISKPRYALISAYLGKVNDNQSYTTGVSLLQSLSKIKDIIVGGNLIANVELSQQIQHDLTIAEVIALPVILLIGIILFQGLYAAILPLVTGISTILITLLLLRIILFITPISVYAINMVIGLGLGLSIDYCLLTIWRYRAEARSGGTIDEILNRTFQKAGKVAIYSAFTVAIAMASLISFPIPFMVSMGIGGIISPIIAALVAVTLLPILISKISKRIIKVPSTKLSFSVGKSFFWEKVASLVTRKALISLLISLIILLSLALPALFLRFTGTTYNSLPDGISAREVGFILNKDLPDSSNNSFYLVVEAPIKASLQLSSYKKSLLDIRGIADVIGPQYLSKNIWIISVVTKSSSYSKESENALSSIERLPFPYKVLPGGPTAEQLSQQRHIAQQLPIALIILVGGTILVIIVMTRSLVLALLTVLTNTLTIISTLGIMVLIFQDGFLSSLLSFTKQNGLVTTQPFLVCAIAFALSTDYGVFLLSSIKERKDVGRTTRLAVVEGLSYSGRIITSAAILFCIAIGMFTFSPVVIIKEIGTGAALAVILDAILVRTLLVPSLITLVSKIIWWPGKHINQYQENKEIFTPESTQKDADLVETRKGVV